MSDKPRMKTITKSARQALLRRWLCQATETSALSITDLHERLKNEGHESTRKTIERDVEDLSLSYPLSEVASNPKRFYFEAGFKLEYELSLTEPHLQTLILSLQAMHQFSSQGLKELCAETELSLLKHLPRPLAREFSRLKALGNASPTVLGEDAEGETPSLDVVLTCLRRGLGFRCTYQGSQSKDPTRLRTFAPLKLHFAGGLYLFAYDVENGDLRMLKVSRIRSATLTNEKVNFKRVLDIDLTNSFGGYGKGEEPVIAYAVYGTEALAKRFREQRIHPSQRIEVIGKNQFRITFRLHDSNEVPRFLSQFGDLIYKIEPESVYEQVKEIWSRGLEKAS